MRRLICQRICDYRSFDEDDSVDGSRASSAQAFKVPKVPKKPAESSAARRPSATGGKLVSKECAGAVDEEDFIRAFTDVPTVQVNNMQVNNYSNNC
uniref:Uncharacterized protein n=1 Tax=Periophthalmus magnuspinnatus TaxID=409849 RepID=A0A3B3ZCA0_9GOBI